MTRFMPQRHDGRQPELFEQDMEELYEHAPCGYLSMLDDGIVARCNATFAEWTGYDKAGLMGRLRFQDLLTAGGKLFNETHLQPLLRMQGFVREIALDVVRRDGSRMPVLVNATLRQRSDAPTVTRVTVFDATDRRRYERELLAAKQRAEELARARSELIAMLSHDIRAPLTAMTTAVALLEKTSSDPKHARYLRVLRSSSSQALALVDNLLDLSRLNAGRAPLRERTFDLRALIGEVEGTARTAAAHKPDVAVQSRVDEAVPALLRGDRAKIAQVLMNLAMNAVKFTDRGFVSLVVTSREITPESVALEMSVSDTGIGIPAERLPHIFEEFTQASDDIAERYGGTGLGLAICQRLLELYGSHLHVSSTVGQGSTFSFSLTLRPVTESEPPA